MTGLADYARNPQSMQNTKISGKADFRGNRIGIAWPISTAPGKMLGVFVDGNLLRWRRNGRLVFGFEGVVQRGQIFVDEAGKFVRGVGEFALQRLNIGELIVARFAFVAQNRAVKLIGMFAQAFLTRNGAAFFRRHNLFTHTVNFSVKVGHVLL